MSKYLILFVFFCFSLVCEAQNPEPGEGYVNVEGGRIWYKVIGEGEGAPLMIVHGGPGGRSCGSIAVYSRLANERPVVLFDQLESGFSDRPNDTSLWKLPYFVKQVEAVKNALNLKNFHLLGSSWGGAIVIEYMLTSDTKEIVSVIFSGPLLSTPKWMEDAEILLSELSSSIQDTIKKYEALKEYYAPAYIAATDSFYARYLSRTKWPPRRSSMDCKGSKGFNAAIYNYMWGPTEFTATGTLSNFDRTDRLHELKLPVLFIAGEFDEVRTETLYDFQKKVEGSQSAIIPGAGHAKTTDNPDAFFRELSQFLNSVDQKRQ